MCQLQTLNYAFDWDSESVYRPRLSSVLEVPSKIIKLDISLNELTSLMHDGLLPFSNLRALDASLNQLRHIQGIEVLHHLYSLNVSHNNIKKVEGLPNYHSLEELNLSNNIIEDISNIPSQINLRVLNLSNNKLQNLKGVTSFPKLEEIYVNHNELTELGPLSTCLHLHILSAASNEIRSLDGVLMLISCLRYMQTLNLSGNPVERTQTYQSEILRAGNIMTLDNVSVRPILPAKEDHRRHAENFSILRDAARGEFKDRLREAKERMEENVNFLQRRIVSIQNEYQEFEQKLGAELENFIRYLDSLSGAELSSADRSVIGASYYRPEAVFPHSWQIPTSKPRYKKQVHKNDYSNIKETEELLRCAFKELTQQRDTNLDLS